MFSGDERSLDVLAVALGQDSPGGMWYVSTLELQLACFEVCVACRAVPTVHVVVDKNMPLSLWGDDGSTNNSPNAPARRRLPSLRAASVTWRMPAGMLVPVLTHSALLRQAEWMQLVGFNCARLFSDATPLPRWDDWTQPGTQPARSPRRRFEEIITFFDREDRVKANVMNPCRVSWPPSIRQLSLGCTLHERVDWTALPSSLERLALGGCFFESIETATWPASLNRLTLGGWFDKSIVGVAWPASLLRLTLGDGFNQPITEVAWPPSLLHLTFGVRFDQPIADVRWPSSLLRLTFGDNFDQPISNVAWPASLLELTFGYRFDQPIKEVVWPASLNWLVFGGRFDQEIVGVAWPASLQHLVLGNGFDQSITGVAWPASLTRLELGNCFDRPITQVKWPVALHTLGFGEEFDQPIEGVVWPTSLRSLAFSDKFVQETEVVFLLPASVESLICVGDGFDEQRDGTDWPLDGMDNFDEPPMSLREDL